MKLRRFAFAGLVLTALALPPLALAVPLEKPIPVREEPCHKVTLENDYIRMIDVHIPEGATTLTHVHVIPSVVVYASDSTIVTQELGAAPAPARHVLPGESRYAAYDEKPLTHRVSNRSAGTFHVLDIELLRPVASVVSTPATTSPDLKLEWEQKLVRCYQLPLAVGKQTELPSNRCAHLLIAIAGSVQTSVTSNAQTTRRELKAGEYLYFAPEHRIQLSNHGGEAATCVLLELK